MWSVYECGEVRRVGVGMVTADAQSVDGVI